MLLRAAYLPAGTVRRTQVLSWSLQLPELRGAEPTGPRRTGWWAWSWRSSTTSGPEVAYPTFADDLDAETLPASNILEEAA